MGESGLALNLTELGMRAFAIHPRSEGGERDMAASHRAARILVVDDDPHLRSSIGAALELQGYSIKSASGSHAAIEILERNEFDLVLTDIVMRDGSGIELLEHIHAEKPHLPVVIVTALHDLDLAVDVMRRGACDYLLKPFKREDLLATVLRALDRRQALEERQNYQQNLEQMVQTRTEMLHQAIEDLEHSYDVTLEVLGEALDLKDSETEGHSKRVTAYSIALAHAVGISADEIKVIARGAFLHDIGKMAIPDAILRKTSRLTAEEMEIVREHCVRGYHMLRNISFLRETAEIVLSHQEYYNGSGYPRGLGGVNIPVGARIFAVADALDAITSDRPYRKVRSFEEARGEIVRCTGTQFDPAIVDAFLKMPSDLWNELRSEITSRNKRFPTFDFGHLSAHLPSSE
jgi:putative nucleotidyltransferase with HDIG domain